MKFNPSHQVTCRSDQRLLVSCSVSNSQELQLQLASDSFVLAGSSLSFTLKDACQNPSSLAFKDKSLAITTLDSSGRQVERKAEFLTLQSLSPAILQSAVVEYSSNALGKQGQVLTLLFRNVNPIPYQGKMELQIPRRPAGQYINANYSILVFTINGIDHQVNSHHLKIPGAAGAAQTLSVQDFIEPGQIVAANAQIKISISEFNNPIERAATNGLLIQTFDNLDSQIDQSRPLLLIVDQPAHLQRARVSLDSGSTTINESSGMHLSFWSPMPLNQGCQLRIFVPEQMANDLYQTVTKIYVYGLFGSLRSLPFTVEQNVLTVRNACSTFVMNDKEANVKVKYLKNPEAVVDTESFQIQVLDQTNNLLAQNYEELSLSETAFTPGKLLIAQILPQNQTVGEQNDIMISIQLNNRLAAAKSPLLKLVAPAAFDLQSSCKFEPYSPKLNANASCSVDHATRTVKISNLSTENLSSADGTLIFKMVGALRNSQITTDKIGNFIIETIVGEENLVDRLEVQDAFSIKPGNLYSVSMEFTPNLSSQPNPELTLSFQIQHHLVSGSDIQLFIPSNELILFQAKPLTCHGHSLNPSSCKIETTPEDSMYILSLQTVENLNAFTFLQITFNDVFKETPRFKGQMALPIVVQTSISNQIIDQDSQLYLQIENALSMSKRELSLSSQTNLEYTSLKVQLEFRVEALVSDWIRIQVPREFQSGDLRCAAPFSCRLDQREDQFFVNVTGLTNTKHAAFEIEGFQNPASTKPFGPFTVSLLDQRGRQVQKSNEVEYLKTSIASSTEAVRMIQSTTEPNQLSNFTFTMERNYQPKDILPWVKLTLPDCIQFSQGKALQIFDQAANQMISPIKYGQFDYVFQLHLGINLYTLLNLLNPKESCLWTSLRLSFEYRAFEDPQLQYIMAARLSGLEPSLSCQAPCATCQAVDKAFCKSCRSESGMLLLKDQGKCIIDSLCPSGYWMDLKICKKCSLGCQECQNGQCTICEAGLGYLLGEDGSCMKKEACITSKGFIIANNACERCHQDCAQCGGGVSSASSFSNSPLYCRVCSNPLKFLHQGQCLDTCPADFVEHNSTTDRVCVSDSTAESENQSSQSQLSLLWAQATKTVIQQEHPVVLLAHFPILLLLLVPCLVIRKCQQTGRTALSNRETLLLSLQLLEYLGTALLGLKGLICYFEYNDYLALLDHQPLENNLVIFYISICIMSMLSIISSHVFNDCFYRKFLQVWEENIREDFHEEFSTRTSTQCCCCETFNVVRYFNFCEWIPLWRKRGWIIPESRQIVSDNICFLFLQFAKRSTAFQFVFKYILLILMVVQLGFVSNPGALFVRQDETVEQEENRKGFVDSVNNLHHFVVNQMIEVIVVGLWGNMLIQKWLIEGDLQQLSVNWEEEDSSSSEEQEQNKKEEIGTQESEGGTSDEDEDESANEEFQDEKTESASERAHEDDAEAGRRKRQSSADQSLRSSIVDHSQTEAIEKREPVPQLDIGEIQLQEREINNQHQDEENPEEQDQRKSVSYPQSTQQSAQKKHQTQKQERQPKREPTTKSKLADIDMMNDSRLSVGSKLDEGVQKPNYNSEGDELDQDSEQSTFDQVQTKARNDTQMANFTFRSVDDGHENDTRRSNARNKEESMTRQLTSSTPRKSTQN